MAALRASVHAPDRIAALRASVHAPDRLAELRAGRRPRAGDRLRGRGGAAGAVDAPFVKGR